MFFESAVFAEIRQAKSGRTAAFTVVVAADIDENQYGDDIGDRLDQLDSIVGKLEPQHLRKVVVQPVENTKDISAPDDVFRLPSGEDDQSNCEPAKGLDGVCC